jgi:uncharacterized protein YegP (UPF0339 family)
MAGTSEIYEDSKGEFRYRLESGNGVVVATGEGYKTKAGAKSGIEAVHRAAANAKVVDETD